MLWEKFMAIIPLKIRDLCMNNSFQRKTKLKVTNIGRSSVSICEKKINADLKVNQQLRAEIIAYMLNILVCSGHTILSKKVVQTLTFDTKTVACIHISKTESWLSMGILNKDQRPEVFMRQIVTGDFKA